MGMECGSDFTSSSLRQVLSGYQSGVSLLDRNCNEVNASSNQPRTSIASATTDQCLPRMPIRVRGCWRFSAPSEFAAYGRVRCTDSRIAAFEEKHTPLRFTPADGHSRTSTYCQQCDINPNRECPSKNLNNRVACLAIELRPNSNRHHCTRGASAAAPVRPRSALDFVELRCLHV
jgi:hypothetical protein